jgi:hypothetical protein
MSEEFLEESVVRPASDLFTWGGISEEERLGKLLLAHPDANQSERIELQKYNELFQRYYERKGIRRSYIFDIAFRHGGVIPVVSLERLKAAVPYTMPVTRRVLIYNPEPRTIIQMGDLANEIRAGVSRFQMLPAGTVVYLTGLTFWKETYDRALVPYTMHPISYTPRTYTLDNLDGNSPLWYLIFSNGTHPAAIYGHYMSGQYRDGLYDPELGYTKGLWTPETLISRVLAARGPQEPVTYRLRYPGKVLPYQVVDLPAYLDRRQAYHRKLYETLRDNMENGITHWATKVMLSIMPGAKGTEPAVKAQIDELVREAREIISVYRQNSCPHFHVRSRFDASFKAETRHQSFLIMSRLGGDRADFRKQYHCTECGLALYCQHEEMQQRKYANPLLDINLEPFYEINEEIISCQYCRRFIGIKESETNIEFDENDRRISGKAVETDSDIRIRDMIVRVARTLHIGAALSANHRGTSGARVKDDVLAAYWLETLRPVIQTIYQEARERSAKKYSIGVYNLLIVLGYVVYSILVERTLPASIVVPGKGGTPNIETLVRATLDQSSKSLFIHNILLQIPSPSKREHFLKVIVEKYIWKILGEGDTFISQKKDTVAIQRFFLEGIGSPTYTTWVQDNVDPEETRQVDSKGPNKNQVKRGVSRLYEYVHRPAVEAIDVPWKARVYGSMCYGDDGHWHDWDINSRSPNPMATACSVCHVTIQQAFDRLRAEDLKAGHVDQVEAAAIARRESEQAATACPRGGFHQIDLDVCLRCGQTLEEIRTAPSKMSEGKSRPGKRPSSNAQMPEHRRKIKRFEAPGVPQAAKVGNLENLVSEYVKLLARVAPTSIDQFKDSVTRIKASSQFSGGFMDEFKIRMGARVQLEMDQVLRTPREVAAAILALCVESLKAAGANGRELAMDQVSFWRAAQGTVAAREYDEKFFQDRELDLEREQQERLMEFLSKTMDQKIADALLGDEVYEVEGSEYPEEPEDIDSEGELNNEDADREANL